MPAAGSGAASPSRIQVPVLAELISRGDGSFVMKPTLPESELDSWITVAEAARVIGNVRPRTVYGLLGRYLVYRRPLRRKTVVSLRSTLAFKQATQDSEFWDQPEQRKRLEQRVTAQMQELALDAAKPLR